MASGRKDIDDLVREAVRQGWSKRFTGGGHIRLTSPEGKAITVATSPGGHRASMNARADLKRAGLRL